MSQCAVPISRWYEESDLTDQEFKTISLSAKADVTLESVRQGDDYAKALDKVLELHREVVEYAVREGLRMPHGVRKSEEFACGPFEEMACALGVLYRCECEVSYDACKGYFRAVYRGTDLEAYVSRATLGAIGDLATRSARTLVRPQYPKRRRRVSPKRVLVRFGMVMADIYLSLMRQSMELGTLDFSSVADDRGRFLCRESLEKGLSRAFSTLGARQDYDDLCQCVRIAVRGCAQNASLLAMAVDSLPADDIEGEVVSEELDGVVPEEDGWALELARRCALTLDCAAFARPRPGGHAVFFVGLRGDASVAAAMCGAMIESVRSENRRRSVVEFIGEEDEPVERCGNLLVDVREEVGRVHLPAALKVIHEVEGILPPL